MATYYLMPTTYQPTGKCNMQEIFKTGKGVRIFEGSRAKADQAAYDYMLELNNGQPFSCEMMVKEKKQMTDVLAIPYSEARDYHDFRDWPCNKESA